MKYPKGWIKLGLFFSPFGGVAQKTKHGIIHGPLTGFAFCKDCNKCLGWSGEWFQLRNHVWEQAWPGTAQRSSAKSILPMEAFLCIACVETRLGRKLERRDFDMRRSINQLRHHKARGGVVSKKMFDRIGRGAARGRKHHD